MDPFEPKSTSRLRPGAYWAVPLNDGRYACGRVLQLNTDFIPTKNRSFFGGLHNWFGDSLPTDTDIDGTGFIAYGVMHIKAITMTGGQILGECELNGLDAEMPIMLSAHGGSDAFIMSGSEAIRTATKDEWGKYSVLGVWGYNFIRSVAEKKLVNHIA